MGEFVIGAISGMVTAIGMGGGTILILLLTIVFGVPQNLAQATNLIFFVPTSIATIIMNLKNKNINFRVGVNVILTGIIGAIVGAVVSNKINTQTLRKFFGAFLVLIALHEIYNFYKLYIKSKINK